PATTLHYTLSLHDALPIFIENRGRGLGPAKIRKPSRFSASTDSDALSGRQLPRRAVVRRQHRGGFSVADDAEILRVPVQRAAERSEEHTSELQSLAYIVCR